MMERIIRNLTLHRSIKHLAAVLIMVAANQVIAEPSSASRAISLDDNDALVDLLGTALGCSLSENLMADIRPTSLYQSTAGNCTAIGASDAEAGIYFTEELCQNAISYEPTGLLEFCSASLDKIQLGNADDLQGKTPVWTLSPGNRFDLGALELRDLSQPYMARVMYKEIETDGGTCRLEMRVYKSSPTATGLRSLIAFHGGSWTSRGFGFFGLEMTAPHFTNAGFVVFAPFYRLLDSKEGNTACHNATIQEISADAEDALQWVVANASEWGASDYPVVFGQSAGGHLAASVSVNQPELVSNAVLYYPPTDFTDFTLQIRDGVYTNEQGLDILQRVIGGPASSVDISASPVIENTFPAVVEINPDLYPPVFFLHGLSDELVNARQSVRLCNGMNGDVAAAEGFVASPDLRQILSCDERDSTLHLIKEGKHALDVCFASILIATDVCPSGSAASRELVADSVAQSVAWAATVADLRAGIRREQLSMPVDESDPANGANDSSGDGDTPVDDAIGASSGGGGAAGVFIIWLLGVGLFVRSCRPRKWHSQ